MLFDKKNSPVAQTYLSGLLTGMVAGLAAGFLFAPRSSKHLRKRMAGTINDQTKEIQHQWKKTKAQAEEAIDNVKTNVGVVADKAQGEFNNYVEKAENKIERLTDATRSGIDRLKDTATLS